MNFEFTGNDSYVTDLLFLTEGGFIFDLEEIGRTEVVYRSRVDTDVQVILSGFFQIDNGAVESGNILGLDFVKLGVPQVSITDIIWTFDEYIDAILAGLNEANFEPFADLLSDGGTINIDASSAQAGYDQSGATFEVRPFLTSPIDFTGSPFGDRVTGTQLDDVIRSGGTSGGRDIFFGSPGNDEYIFDGAGRQAEFFLGYESETDPVSISINSFENTGSAVWMGGVDVLTNVSGALSSDVSADDSGDLALGGTNADDQFDITLRPDDYVLIFPRDGADSISLDAQGAGAFIIYTFGLGTQAGQGLQIDLGDLSVQNDGFGNSEQIQLTGTPEEFGIQGTNNADTVITGGMDEFFFLLDGDDSLTAGTGGDDSVDGGDGTDTVFVNHTLGTSTVTFAEGLSTLVDRNGPAASTEMREVEFIAASDGNLELAKHDGIGLISAADLTALTELYIAYFDRAADALGLSFWATAFQKNGFSLRDIADQFFTQPETQALYSGVSDGDFVQAVYNNVLGRDADIAGFEFWTGQLSSGNVSESGFILELLAGARAQTGDPADVAYIEAKTDIGLYFAVTQGQNNLDDARAVMDTFNGSEGSVIDAIAVADAAYQDALASTDTLLMPVVGVIESPFDGIA